MKKRFDEATQLVEEMTSNSIWWSNKRVNRTLALGVHEVDRISIVNVKLDVLAKRLESLDMKVVLTLTCDICGGGHSKYEC